MKLRRCHTYTEITAEEKQAMLLQRSSKELNLQKPKSVIDCQGKKIQSPQAAISSKQIALTMKEPPSANVQGWNNKLLLLYFYY